MKKFIRWLKAANENAKARRKLVLAARELLADMDPNWRPEAGKSGDEVAFLLMSIGWVHLQALYQEKVAAQNILRSSQATLN